MTKYTLLAERIEMADKTRCNIGHSDIGYTHLRHLLAISLEVIKRKKSYDMSCKCQGKNKHWSVLTIKSCYRVGKPRRMQKSKCIITLYYLIIKIGNRQVVFLFELDIIGRSQCAPNKHYEGQEEGLTRR